MGQKTVEEKRAAHRAWYEKNREKILAADKAKYAAAHPKIPLSPEKLAARAERRRERSRQYARQRVLTREQKDRVNECDRARRKERAALRPPKPPKLTVEQLLANGRAQNEVIRRRRGQLPMAEFKRRRREKSEARHAEKAAEAASRSAARTEKLRVEREALRSARKDRQREKARAWRLANPQRNRELQNKWKRANPEKAKLHKSRKGSRKRRIKWLMKVQRGRCAICREKLGSEVHIDHIIPVSKGGPNSRSNIQLACPPCNISKRDRDPIEFNRSLGRLL